MTKTNPGTERSNSQSKKCILIVEDDKCMSDMISDILTTHRNYEILTTADGEEGLRIVREEGNLIDLIITDCRHTKLNGIEMSKIIREEYPHMPIIMCTGHYGAVKSQIPERVFLKVYPKPFKVQELIETVEATLLS